MRQDHAGAGRSSNARIDLLRPRIRSRPTPPPNPEMVLGARRGLVVLDEIQRAPTYSTSSACWWIALVSPSNSSFWEALRRTWSEAYRSLSPAASSSSNWPVSASARPTSKTGGDCGCVAVCPARTSRRRTTTAWLGETDSCGHSWSATSPNSAFPFRLPRCADSGPCWRIGTRRREHIGTRQAHVGDRQDGVALLGQIDRSLHGPPSQPWFENLAKRQVKAPKIYLRDTGILRALRGTGSEDIVLSHPRVGASWEGFVIEQVLGALRPTDAWFRSAHGGGEVDLLILEHGRRLGFEMKFGEAPEVARSTHNIVEALVSIICSSLAQAGRPIRCTSASVFSRYSTVLTWANASGRREWVDLLRGLFPVHPAAASPTRRRSHPRDLPAALRRQRRRAGNAAQLPARRHRLLRAPGRQIRHQLRAAVEVGRSSHAPTPPAPERREVAASRSAPACGRTPPSAPSAP